jgi:hypothetical protein
VNLHQIVAGAIGTVNPQVPCTIQQSTGYTIGADGTQAPTYTTVSGVPCQIQALTYSDLQKMQGLNIQGLRRAVYVNGNFNGVVRPALKGGDLITTPDGRIWLVAIALEQWPDWCKCAITLQNGS